MSFQVAQDSAQQAKHNAQQCSEAAASAQRHADWQARRIAELEGQVYHAVAFVMQQDWFSYSQDPKQSSCMLASLCRHPDCAYAGLW